MNERFKKYLPLGSVVLMKEAKKRVMITGYAVQSPDSGDKLWDYIGCLWPEGMISPDKNLLFDHENIDKIFAIGYTDEEQKRFMGVLAKATALREERLNKENVIEKHNAEVIVEPAQNQTGVTSNNINNMPPTQGE